MQTRKDNDFVGFEQGAPETLGASFAEQMDAGKADRATIAKMPDEGTEVELNGLVFEVQQVTKSGNVILEPKGRD